MSAIDRVIDDDVTVRMYLASVIGPLRAPFGRRSQVSLTAGQTVELVRNSTRDKVLFVSVYRGDPANNGNTASVIFSQNSGQPSTNDFFASVTNVARFTFVLKPDESLTVFVQGISGPPINNLPFVVAQETF